MLPEHAENIQTGLLLFLIIGVAILVPVVAFHYFRFSRLEPRRSLVLYTALLYGLVMIALVLLPFPPAESVCDGRQATQWVPFGFIADIGADLAARGRSWFAAPISFPALSFAFNIALFVPLGVLLRKAYGLKPEWVVATGFAVSLAIEITQVTGNFGSYPCPYRLCDVDDLIANTGGAAIGGLIAPAALIVPRVLPADEVCAQPEAVSLPRQIVAYGLDVFLFGVALIFTRSLIDSSDVTTLWVMMLLFTLIRVLAPLLTDGYTPAGRLLKFKVRLADGSRVTAKRLILREIVGPFGVLVVVGLVTLCGVVALSAVNSPADGSGFVLALPEPELITSLVGFTGLFTFALLLLVPAARRDQRAWHDRIAGLRCVRDTPRPARSTVRSRHRVQQ